MGQIAITLNDRTYRLRCGDGEEQHLLELATHVSARVEGLVAEFGQVGDDRLMLMAALMITDELWEARAEIARLQQHTGFAVGERTVEPPFGDMAFDAGAAAPTDVEPTDLGRPPSGG